MSILSVRFTFSVHPLLNTVNAASSTMYEFWGALQRKEFLSPRLDDIRRIESFGTPEFARACHELVVSKFGPEIQSELNQRLVLLGFRNVESHFDRVEFSVLNVKYGSLIIAGALLVPDTLKWITENPELVNAVLDSIGALSLDACLGFPASTTLSLSTSVAIGPSPPNAAAPSNLKNMKALLRASFVLWPVAFCFALLLLSGQALTKWYDHVRDQDGQVHTLQNELVKQQQEQLKIDHDWITNLQHPLARKAELETGTAANIVNLTCGAAARGSERMPSSPSAVQKQPKPCE